MRERYCGWPASATGSLGTAVGPPSRARIASEQVVVIGRLAANDLDGGTRISYLVSLPTARAGQPLSMRLFNSRIRRYSSV